MMPKDANGPEPTEAHGENRDNSARGWQVASLLAIIIGIAATIQAIQYPFGDESGPGPGFFPLFIGILLCGSGMALFVSVTRNPPRFEPEQWPTTNSARARVLTIVGGLAAIAALLEIVGFRLTMLVFLVIMPIVLGARRWIVVIAFAIICSFGTYYVFTQWLQVPLPVDFLGI